MAKSFLFKPLLSIFKTYEMPDGGSYQLEDLLGKEIVFLKDFEYDGDAKKWMTWAYLERFLEGGDVPVARPNNRGGNVLFKNDAPIFLAALEEVSFVAREARGRVRDGAGALQDQVLEAPLRLFRRRAKGGRAVCVAIAVRACISKVALKTLPLRRPPRLICPLHRRARRPASGAPSL
jgi:hypothetical protein